jgi:site-specific recombinase XerC
MPKARGQRKRVAESIYQDTIGYEAVVSIGSGKTRRSKSKRFKKGTGMREMKAWQDGARAALRKRSPKTSPGTLAADAIEYLKGVTSMPSFDARRADLQAWLSAFGTRPRLSLTKSELQQQMNTWREAGVAGSTLNHRKQALSAVYKLLNEDDDPNPAEKLASFPQADVEPRALDLSVVDEILNAMPQSKARAMLRVMRATGHPFERQRQLVPLHVQLDQKRVFLVARKKGKGTKGKWYPLTQDGVTAYQEFVDLASWGGISKVSIYVSFMRGRDAANRERVKAGQPLIPPCRPYDLRHSLGTEAYKRLGDIRAVAELLDCTVETALRYTLGAVPTRMQAVVDELDRMVAQDGNAGKQAQNAQ